MTNIVYGSQRGQTLSFPCTSTALADPGVDDGLLWTGGFNSNSYSPNGWNIVASGLPADASAEYPGYTPGGSSQYPYFPNPTYSSSPAALGGGLLSVTIPSDPTYSPAGNYVPTVLIRYPLAARFCMPPNGGPGPYYWDRIVFQGSFTIVEGVAPSGSSSSNSQSSNSSSSNLSLASSSNLSSSSSQRSLSSISSQSLTSLTSTSSGVSASSSLSSALSGSSGSTPSSSFSNSATSLISTGSGVSASSSGTTGSCVPINNYYVNLRGWEVGQRTNEFLSDYAHTETSTLVWRDELATTEVRTRQQLIHYDYGDAGIPSWLKGAKSFDVLNGLVPYPDRSILRALTDLFRARVFSLPIEQAMSCFGPGSDLETGKQNLRFRKAFFMSAALSTTDPSGFTYSPGDAATSGLFSTSGTVTIREAASYWDFSTAFDPVYLALDTEEGYLFRNLDPVTQFISSTTAPVSTIITDDPVAFIWAGSPSLSDSTYMPPAMAERLEAPGLDLSGGVLSAGGSPSASFLSPGLSLTYPVSQFTTS